MSESASSMPPSVRRFNAVATLYDRFRPGPPAGFADEVLSCIDSAPNVVVDIGCGTGSSSRYWEARARTVVGVEPNDEMRKVAIGRTGAPNIVYRSGYGHCTGLDSASADVVTCFQSLHWMEPKSTLLEIARVLRQGGVLAVADYEWPPSSPSPSLDAAWLEAIDAARKLEHKIGLREGLTQWDKKHHLASMAASGHFTNVREVVVTEKTTVTAAQYMGMLRTQCGVAALLTKGISAETLKLGAVEQLAADFLVPSGTVEWHTRVRLGVK